MWVTTFFQYYLLKLFSYIFSKCLFKNIYKTYTIYRNSNRWVIGILVGGDYRFFNCQFFFGKGGGGSVERAQMGNPLAPGRASLRTSGTTVGWCHCRVFLHTGTHKTAVLIKLTPFPRALPAQIQIHPRDCKPAMVMEW